MLAKLQKLKENKEYTIAFGKDNGVIADINQGLDNDKLNQLVAHLNEAENIRAQERYNSLSTSSDTLSNR